MEAPRIFFCQIRLNAVDHVRTDDVRTAVEHVRTAVEHAWTAVKPAESINSG